MNNLGKLWKNEGKKKGLNLFMYNCENEASIDIKIQNIFVIDRNRKYTDLIS